MEYHVSGPREVGNTRWTVYTVGGSFGTYSDGDLGTGKSQQVWAFESEGYARQFAIMQPRIDNLERKLTEAIMTIDYLHTSKGANRNLKEVRKRKKAERLSLKETRETWKNV